MSFDCDVLVVGSGVAGLSAAITAAHRGLKVTIVEKADHVGGTTARSGGWLWMPNTRLSQEKGVDDSPEKVREYLKAEAGPCFDEQRVEAFLQRCPEALEFFLQHTDLKVELNTVYPDYHPEASGASKGGRAMSTVPLDGRELGDDIRLVASPLPELMVFGMMLGSGKEIWHFLRVLKSFESFRFVCTLLAKNGLDVMRYGRTMRLTNGNALVGRLLKSARAKGVRFELSTALIDLVKNQGTISGAWVEKEGQKRQIRSRLGVVLASGGFSHSIERRRALFAHAPSGTEHWSPGAPTNTGDGQFAAERAGAAFSDKVLQPAAWFPVSLPTRPDGSTGVIPHFIDRAKPGVIAVDHAGRRFANEASSYHDFVQKLMASAKGKAPAYAWLVCDRLALRTYGLGRVAAFPMPIGRHLRSGYLRRGNDARALAAELGIDPDTLEHTINSFNSDAANGIDNEFGKGRSHYNRFMGDPFRPESPCLRPLQAGPLYAIKVVVGDAGTFAGLVTDADSRVLDSQGHAIPGLYAAGNDAVSVMGGAYPGAGITLGPALVAGFSAGNHLARVPHPDKQETPIAA